MRIEIFHDIVYAFGNVSNKINKNISAIVACCVSHDDPPPPPTRAPSKIMIACMTPLITMVPVCMYRDNGTSLDLCIPTENTISWRLFPHMHVCLEDVTEHWTTFSHSLHLRLDYRSQSRNCKDMQTTCSSFPSTRQQKSWNKFCIWKAQWGKGSV